MSHESIYRSLFIQARGVLKKELLGHLRSKSRIRQSRHADIYKGSRVQIAGVIAIRERPAEVADRSPGGDLLRGSRNSHIVTLVERHSRFTTLIKVPSKDTAVSQRRWWQHWLGMRANSRDAAPLVEDLSAKHCQLNRSMQHFVGVYWRHSTTVPARGVAIIPDFPLTFECFGVVVQFFVSTGLRPEKTRFTFGC